MPGIIFVNHLKHAYNPETEGGHLLISDTSFYRMTEETAWLIKELPAQGSEETFLNHLSGLGLKTPDDIFRRLVSIKALEEKSDLSPSDLLRKIFNPKIRIIPAKMQEPLLKYSGISNTGSGIFFHILTILAAGGILWGTLLVLAGPAKAIPAPLFGQPSWLLVFLLALAGSLFHELGHSLTAAASGIGLRPIGLSMYLVFPSFHTNVSGIETLSLQKKALIDCGGLIFQGVFLLFLLLAATFSGVYLFAEAARWMMVLVLFNLNPFLRTDAYWLYKDLSSELKNNVPARLVRLLYLVGYILFSAYFFVRLAVTTEGIAGNLARAFHSPGTILSQGYMPIIWAYFLILALIGSLQRLREIRQEWNEISSTSKANA